MANTWLDEGLVIVTAEAGHGNQIATGKDKNTHRTARIRLMTNLPVIKESSCQRTIIIVPLWGRLRITWVPALRTV